MNRRDFIAALGASATVAVFASNASAAVNHKYGAKPRASVPSRALKGPEVVPFPDNFVAGAIVISLGRKRLYLSLGGGRAICYPVAVGKAGKAWTGATYVASKQTNPAWVPPAEVKRDNPRLPDIIAGGAPNNPMGPRALVLGRAEIAIHGTTASMRRSIGSAASYGCIRMYNEDVVDLFDRVSVGAPVIAIA